MRRLHRSSIIERAKREVPLPMVLALAGVSIEALPERGVAIKAWCPWSAEHPDGGAEKEMRVYAGNDCYCFVCAQSMDTVSIAARLWGSSQPDAARRLLERYAEAKTGDDGVVDPTALERRSGAVAALAVWATAHGHSRFTPAYRRCLSVADAITTDADVDRWLAHCKGHLDRHGTDPARTVGPTGG